MYSLTKDFKEPKFPIGFFTVYNFLTDEEINVILNSVDKTKLSSGKLMEEQSKPSYLQYETKPDVNNDHRKSNIAWINYNKTNIPLKNIFKKIYNQIIEVNETQFGFDLTDVEPFQFTSYLVGEYYKQHLDLDNNLNAGNLQRKLSFSIQLSDENDYEGGELCCYIQTDPIVASKQKGSVTFFPSFLLHEVKEVTKGHRYSLVGWVHGPRFV